jgi:hypothetical protein
MARRVSENLRPSVRRGDKMDIRNYVKVKTIVGGTTPGCTYVDGVVFRHDVAHKKMRSAIPNAHVSAARWCDLVGTVRVTSGGAGHAAVIGAGVRALGEQARRV